jgi:hypothetical protein
MPELDADGLPKMYRIGPALVSEKLFKGMNPSERKKSADRMAQMYQQSLKRRKGGEI